MQAVLSVGIDVGTSTTQVIFSRLYMENSSGFFSVPNISIVDKEVIYKSNIYMTPLKTQVLIDVEKLKDIVAAEFAAAGFTPEEVETGAVIITGESARKENSDAVLQSLSGFAGDFVVAAAGPDMESLIAGKGSGAYQYSIEEHCSVVNLDIGGGTTNIVVFEDGNVTARGCLDIGGRLICVDEQRRITKVSPAAEQIARQEQIVLKSGQEVSVYQLKAVVRRMARVLEGCLGLSTREAAEAEIRTPGSSELLITEKPRAINFIYQDEADVWKYGDIGVLLGQAVKKSRLFQEFHVINPEEPIRATVVGAGSYTTSISGSTISYSTDIFPLKNILIVKLDERLQNELFEGRIIEVLEYVRWYLEQNAEQFVLAMHGKENPDYEELKTAAGGIREIMEELLPDGYPVLIVFECDIAKAMGQIIRRLPGFARSLVSIDSIRVENGEYIDMGSPLMDGLVIPVVVKTLILG